MKRTLTHTKSAQSAIEDKLTEAILWHLEITTDKVKELELCVQELQAIITTETTNARIDEVANIRKQFHSHRFGISEFMNDRLKALQKEQK